MAGGLPSIYLQVPEFEPASPSSIKVILSKVRKLQSVWENGITIKLKKPLENFGSCQSSRVYFSLVNQLKFDLLIN